MIFTARSIAVLMLALATGGCVVGQGASSSLGSQDAPLRLFDIPLSPPLPSLRDWKLPEQFNPVSSEGAYAPTSFQVYHPHRISSPELKQAAWLPLGEQARFRRAGWPVRLPVVVDPLWWAGNSSVNPFPWDQHERLAPALADGPRWWPGANPVAFVTSEDGPTVLIGSRFDF